MTDRLNGITNAPQTAFEILRAAYQAEPNPSIGIRYDRLQRLETALDKFSDRLIKAMSDDFGYRSAVESENFDITVTLGEIRSIRGQFARWANARRMPVPKHLLPAKARILPQPLGVIGIMSPWNFPVNLSLMPLAAALAAGNRVLLKPSELTPLTSMLLKELVNAAFAVDEVDVVLGDASVAGAFSRIPFDHLLFTGSTKVGQIVYEAASKNLTPVTLELGGKSPAIIAPSGDVQLAARRIAWGKLANAGQICIAPDYVLVEKSKLTQFINCLNDSAQAFYGGFDGPDGYTSIINDRQFMRLSGMLEEAARRGAEVLPLPVDGMSTRPRQFKPHVIINPPDDTMMMQDEIFGPLLPIITYERMSEAIDYVKMKDHPLALYLFAKDKAEQDIWLNQVSAGGVCLNDVLMHFACDSLPFGGVGKSGFGAYHGQAGYERFSHLKPIFSQSKFNAAFLFEPPFKTWKKTALKLLRRVI